MPPLQLNLIKPITGKIAKYIASTCIIPEIFFGVFNMKVSDLETNH
jgi:hypothetical protein